MRKITVNQGQTLEDVAIQEYGTIYGVITLIDDNDLGLDDDLYPGQELLIQDEVPTITETNVAIAAQIRDKKIFPNSGVPGGTPPGSGYVEIGYWIDDYA